MQPTARTPAHDLIPYNHEDVFVVGCGSQPNTHAGQPHTARMNNVFMGARLAIALNLAYTMDINPAIVPSRVGSFWIEDHTEDLPPNTFRFMLFENLPGNLLQDRGWCLTAMRTAKRLLVPHGLLIISAGLGVVNPGSNLDFAMQDTFGIPNVASTQDQFGMSFDIRAVK